jgi:hypothetical protein
MKNIIALFVLLLSFSNCSNKKNNFEATISSNYNIYKVEVSTNKNYYDSNINLISDTAFVILQEKENIMFSYADKILEHNNKYFILDKTLRSIVSFKKGGNPITKYGQIGQGPGEYVSPWDFDIDTTGLYVLDTKSKKVIHYSEEGSFLKERKIPFFADAIKRLENGNFMFNTTPDGTPKPSLIYTDSEMNIISKSLNYRNNYIGGYTTNNIIRSSKTRLNFYRSPSDSLTILDKDGKIKAFIIFDFLNKSVPQIAKTDYIKFSQKEQSTDYLHFANNPICISDSIWIGLLEDGDNQYTAVFNPFTNNFGYKKFTRESSVYDIIEPMFSDNNGSIISLISPELNNMCKDYNLLPDSITNALNKGNRVLLINRIKQY